MKKEAFDVVDTSTWTQKAREEYSEYELRKASNSRDIKHLNIAIKFATNLEAESFQQYVCDRSDW